MEQTIVKHFEELPEDKIVFVNVYRVTREYGGPEEGGWWYNNFDCIEILPVKNVDASVMAVSEAAWDHYEDEAHGDIYSVLGGTEIHVRVESKPKASETRERPHYE